MEKYKSMKINFLNSLFFLLSVFLLACNGEKKQETALSQADAALILPYIDDTINHLSTENKRELALQLADYQKQTKNKVRIIFTNDFAPHKTMGQFLRVYARDNKFSPDSAFMLIGIAVNRGIPDVFPNWRMKQMVSQKEIDDLMRLIVNGWANQELYKGLINSVLYLKDRGTILGETFLQMSTPCYSVEQAMQKPDSIFRLDLRNQKLSIFPKEILQLKNLNELWLSKNQLKEIPTEITQLVNLQLLDLSNNAITTLPESLKMLKNLKKINLTNNPQIDGNQIFNLLAQLPKLQSIEINFCKIETLPTSITQMKQLKDLQMTGNQLKEIPTEIGALENLEFLVVNRNELTTLPDGIGKLQKLQLLYADSNRISQVPPQIGELKKLYVLRLHHNELTNLPPQIGELKALEKLYLSNNQFTILSPLLKNLGNLQDLTVSQNRLDATEKETIKKLFPKIKLKE